MKVSVGRQVVKENGGNVRGGSLALNDFLFTSIKREKDTGDGRRIPARRAELGDKWVNLASILRTSPSLSFNGSEEDLSGSEGDMSSSKVSFFLDENLMSPGIQRNVR